MAFGVSANTSSWSEPVSIDVERNDNPVTLTASFSALYFEYNSDRLKLSVTGTFADGSKVDLTRSTKLHYSSSEVAATVDSEGMVTAQYSGVDTVLITYNNAVSLKVPVVVPDEIRISPPDRHMYAGESQRFAAIVATADPNKSATWQIYPPDLGTIDGTGLYTPPTTISEERWVFLVATPVADPMAAATATIYLHPPASVTVTPGTTTVSASQTRQFAANVANVVGGIGVNWSVTPEGAGTITQSGLYTAPASVPVQQTATVTASSTWDDTIKGTATVTLPATDSTPPQLTSQVTPAPNANGWNHAPVTITFACTDSGSGVKTGFPTGATTLSANTAGTTVTGTCTDNAGNTTTQSVGPIRIDLTSPTITYVSAAPVNSAGWSNGPVTVTWSCADAFSGPVATTVTSVVNGPGSNLSATGTCYDQADNSDSNTKTGINIDTTPPLVVITSPQPISYPRNSVVYTSYSCDALGGAPIVTCTAPFSTLGNRLPTSAPGTFVYAVAAMDAAGNIGRQNVTYTITP
jgi:hypothetical protein